MIRMQRLQYDKGSGNQTKLTNGVQIPQSIDFASFSSLVAALKGDNRQDEGSGESQYVLVSVVHHHGDHANCGHYTCHVQAGGESERLAARRRVVSRKRPARGADFVSLCGLWGFERAVIVGDAHPWRPMKQPILRFSVKPVAFRDVTQRPAGQSEETGKGAERQCGTKEEKENLRNGNVETEVESGMEGTRELKRSEENAISREWTRDEDKKILIKQLGMAASSDPSEPSDLSDLSDFFGVKSSKKEGNSGKQNKAKDKKKKAKPAKPAKPAKRVARSHASDDDDSEEWGNPSKRKRLGGSARSRRMVSNNQTGQSAYMCL